MSLVVSTARLFEIGADSGSAGGGFELRTKTCDMTILCFALSTDRVRTRDESRLFELMPIRLPVNVRVRDVG
jgi:hypothetical protein